MRFVYLVFILLYFQYAKNLTLFICVITQNIKKYNIINRSLLIFTLTRFFNNNNDNSSK